MLLLAKISIITVCYNAEKHIEQTIRSVVNQTYSVKEYIVIDGRSTDSTVEIIKKYEEKIDRWVSEPDGGIADAMNKGLRLATGDFVIFIHSDDYLIDKYSLENACHYLNDNYGMFFFPVITIRQGIKNQSAVRKLNFFTNFKLGSCHQGHITRRSLFEDYGLFDIKFKICMDYDFVLRCYRNGVRALTINIPFSAMRLNGISSRLDWPGLRERIYEEKKAHMKNCSSGMLKCIYYIYWGVYPKYKYFINKTKQVFMLR